MVKILLLLSKPCGSCRVVLAAAIHQLPLAMRIEFSFKKVSHFMRISYDVKRSPHKNFSRWFNFQRFAFGLDGGEKEDAN